ncbi:MAG TPA: PQQ-dependent sugar dehydrogenase [Candidatus Didemnitutus sp.]|nr:PQQ-dependent sugar dehydrogenase [Candidatus Didemnitutus sp.]
MHTCISAADGWTRVVLTHALLLLAVVGGAALPAQITRVANTTLTLPQNPATFGYTTEVAFPGLTFDQPVGIVTAPGDTDRVFIVEKTGRVQMVTGIHSTPVKQVFLDLSARVLTNSEEGLLGLAFHPDFASNHYFYVYYSLTATTSDGSGDHERVARFTALPSPATNADILATEMPMITQYDEAPNHNAGDLHFGSDGYLYVAIGDEGGANDQYANSQRIDKDFFSGILRLDVDNLPGNLAPNPHPAINPGTYKVPADNPFVGATSFNGLAVTAAAVRTEFWAVGLRNPWRFSFDPPTGRLFAGDVGQSAREEIDLITKGGNYGWNYREGTIAGPRSNPPPGAQFIDPIWDADRNTAQTITGGVVYRGTRFAQLYGLYVFGDYQVNKIFTMAFPASGPVQVQQIATETTPVGFGIDPGNGDILVACIGTGAITRLVYNTTSTGTALPATLSATGAFSDLASLTPNPGIVDYGPNISFWSDFAQKRRWFSVPALADKITFAAEGNWTFPAGTVWVKHFDLELTRGEPSTARRVETRFLVKTAAGVYGVTYQWNDAQTEATLVPEAGADQNFTINVGGSNHTQTWHFPSRSECLQCHTPVAGQALSFNTAQLNAMHTYPGGTVNQLTALLNAGYFINTVPDPSTLRALASAGDTTQTLEYRVRSYLAANCVQCHQPGGAAQGLWDARITTPTSAAGLVRGALLDDLGDADNRVIAPGDLLHSVLLDRISVRGAKQMPPLASNEVDATNVALVISWVRALGDASRSDFDGDNQPDILWQNSSTGDRAVWLMNGTSIGNFGYLAGIPTAWSMAGSADFDGDGHADLVWENRTTGDRTFWLLNGTTISSFVYLAYVDPAWHIAAVGDFNGDGQTDLVWENLTTGDRTVWFMNGTSIGSFGYLANIPAEWRIVGAGDFNSDGQTDLVWENTTTGDRSVWYLNGTTIQSFGYVAGVDVAWHIAAVADFNGDGQPDLLWENSTTGDRAFWLMNGIAQASAPYLAYIDPVWKIAP